GEGLVSREQVKRRWRKLISNEMWDELGSNDELVDRIEAEKVRRVHDGSAKREKAQLAVVKAPAVLEEILLNTQASPKHRIDASRTLDQFVGNAAEAAEQDGVKIVIIVGNDKNLFSTKAVRPDSNDKIIDATPQELPPPRRGRPPGSKNKPKELQQGNDDDE